MFKYLGAYSIKLFKKRKVKENWWIKCKTSKIKFLGWFLICNSFVKTNITQHNLSVVYSELDSLFSICHYQPSVMCQIGALFFSFWQNTCWNRCKITLVAFDRFFSRMNFQMRSQIVCSNRCKVTLSSQMDCLNRFKVLLSEPQYLPHLLLEGGNSGPGAQITVMFLPGGNLGPGDSGPKAQIAAMVLTGGDWGPGDLGPSSAIGA